MKNGRRIILGRLAACVSAVISAAVVSTSPLMAEELSFAPTVEDSTASIEISMQKLDTKSTTRYGSYDTSQFSSIERLRVGADGFIYHPRFIIFSVKGAIGLDQNSYEFANGGHSGASHVLDEYDIRAIVLPEHPYNLELFTRRMTVPLSPLYAGDATSSSSGAIFRYRHQPFSVYLSAVSESIESRDETDTTQYTASISHFFGPFVTTARYTQADTSSTTGIESSRAASYFNNTFRFNPLNIVSNAGKERQSQTNVAGEALQTDLFTWTEQLDLTLPLNLTAGYIHDYRKDELTEQAGPPSPQSYSFSRNTTDSATLSHRLYNSLVTSYTAFWSSSESVEGAADSNGQTVALSYIKLIPTGSLQAGYSFQDSSSNRTGTVSVTNEHHAGVAVGDYFVLNYPGADWSSVTVMVYDPTLQALLPMVANSYSVFQYGTTVRVNILLPPASVTPAPTYEFVVNYVLPSVGSSIESRTNGFNIALHLIDGLFNPYFSYSIADQESVSEVFFADTDRVVQMTYGYTVQEQPFILAYEYTEYRSRLNPYESWKASLDYRQPVSDEVDIFGRIYYSETTRGVTDVTFYASGYSEKTTSLNLTARKKFPYEHLELFFSGYYTATKVGETTNNTYTFTPIVRWHVGKLDVTASMSKSFAITTAFYGRQTFEQDGYYLTINRKLF